MCYWKKTTTAAWQYLPFSSTGIVFNDFHHRGTSSKVAYLHFILSCKGKCQTLIICLKLSMYAIVFLPFRAIGIVLLLDSHKSRDRFEFYDYNGSFKFFSFPSSGSLQFFKDEGFASSLRVRFDSRL